MRSDINIALDPRPRGQRVVGGRAWQQGAGALVWRGKPTPPPPPRFAEGALVEVTRSQTVEGRKLAAGTVCTVIMAVSPTLFSVTPVVPAEREAWHSGRTPQPWLVHWRSLALIADADAEC